MNSVECQRCGSKYRIVTYRRRTWVLVGNRNIPQEGKPPVYRCAVCEAQTEEKTHARGR